MTIKEEYIYEKKDSEGATVEGYAELTPEMYYEVLVKREVNQLERYFITMETELYKKSQDDKYYYDFLVEKNGKEISHRVAYIDKIDEIYDYQVNYPHMLRYSFLISVYSFAEERLLNACRRTAKLLGVRELDKYVEEESIREGGVFLAHKYLKEFANINLSKCATSWTVLCVFNRLRNCIVHQRGNVEPLFYGKTYHDRERKRQLEKAIYRLGSDIVVVEKGHIKLTHIACSEFLKAVDMLLAYLYDNLHKRLNKNLNG
ncbi:MULTISPECIES: hypothetical protein [unclassified Priestia]|uniref:hypothetical protein n=1 Tax=unclassified Priestia TaxID=2800374 RepID=UPI0036700DDF